jgi:hypothetical protein
MLFLRNDFGTVFYNAFFCNFSVKRIFVYTENIFFFLIVARGAATNSAYYGYPQLWILRHPAQRCHAVPSPGFEPTTLWLSPTS